MRIRSIVIGIFLMTVGGMEVARAQSLGEVARRERQRRRELGEDGPARVIGNEDLERSRGEGFSVTGARAEEASKEPLEPDVDSSPPRLTANEVRELRDRWAEVWRRRMKHAEAALARARDDLYQCRAASRYFFVPLAIDCRDVEGRLAEAEANLEKVEANRYNWELLLPE